MNFKSLLQTIRFQLFIQAKPTPNPNFLKFVPSGKIVMQEGTVDFAKPRQALNSPLALKLFAIDGVTRVFYGRDYISISKAEAFDWSILKPSIFEAITEFYNQEQPLFINKQQREDTQINEKDSETVQLIKEIIDTKVRPVVAEDGGDIVYKEFDEKTGIVYVEMKGSCSGCPSSGVTLKNGIERMLTHYIQEVKEVRAQDYVGE